MHPNPKREAQKTEDAGFTAKPLVTPRVTKKDAPGKSGTEQGSADASRPRPRQDSLDLQRAADEGMVAPISER